LWAEFPGDESPEFSEWLVNVKAKGDEMQEKLGEFNQHNLHLMSDLSDAQTRIKVWKHASEEYEEVIEAVRYWYRCQVGNQVGPQDIVELGKFLEVLGDE